ncbi:MAG: DUF3570 domain-containing protein [Flavobacteriales bacterium]|nr:DUF3570 domain-containing protein [Flavobacteriales bacterium]
MLTAQQTDDTVRVFKQLDPVQVNFIYGYYEQDGVHSPVTGGIGDEELTDNVGKITVNIPVSKSISISLLGGIDYYTSASTDNINNEHDFYVETSASRADSRKYGDLGIQAKNEKRRFVVGINGGFSEEWDVSSRNAGLFVAKESKNKNRQFKLSTSYYRDDWDLIYPEELRKNKVGDQELLPTNIRHLYDGALTYVQIINKRMKAALTVEAVYQQGLLSTPFHRVYFTDTISHDIERLPDSRFKLPLGLHVNYKVNDFLITRLYYRFYLDDFGIKAHTIDMEYPLKVFKFLTVSPFYRFHIQTSAKYFAPFAQHIQDDVYYTSDYDLAEFMAHKYGVGLKYAPLFGLFKSKVPLTKKTELKFKKVEVRVAKYNRLIDNETVLKAFSLTGYITFEIQ